MPMGYFEKTSTGDVLSRITNDVDTLRQSLNQGITQLITSATTIVGVLAMMLSIDAPMTLIALAVIPVSGVLVKAVVGRSQKYFRAQQRNLG
ncbi:MAG: ABC transporter transmembrane domain-containing protein [Eggerthellaceae bacterium]